MKHCHVLTVVPLFVLVLLAAGCGQSGETGLCDGIDCSNHGVCVTENGGAQCLCETGYIARCATCVTDPCAEWSCGHGACIATDNLTAACICDVGYTGNHCDACKAGYYPEGLECVKGDPCGEDPCVYGVCAMVNGEPQCTCHDGYAGRYCDTCDDGYHAENLACIPDGVCAPNPCLHGACSPSGDSYTCDCGDGYQGDRCDECAAGYHADGINCVQDALDPCDPNSCTTEPNRSVCEQVGDSAICLCDDGFHEEFGTCMEDSPCAPNPCTETNKTVCTVDGEGYICDCDDGYFDDNGLCRAGDACNPNPCTEANKTRCRIEGESFVCLCVPGYHDDGGACVQDTECNADTTCSGNGTCTGNGLECTCDIGWTGANCDACGDGYQDSDHNDTCLPDCDTAALNCEAGGQRCEIVAGEAVCVGSVRSCDTLVTFKPANGSFGPFYIRGEFNGWSENNPLTNDGSGRHNPTLHLDTGEYAYKIYDKGRNEWFEDPGNPLYKWTDGTRNSRLSVPDCSHPLLQLAADPVTGSDGLSFAVTYVPGSQGTPLDAQAVEVRLNGEAYTGYSLSGDTFSIDESGLAPGKYSFLFRVQDTEGRRAEPLFVPLWVQQKDFDWNEGVMYFVMTDRYANGDASNDYPISDNDLDWKASWQGGDFAGLTDKVEAGYFDDLGVNVIWISSISMNTQTAWWGSDGHKYSGYHSYWPISTGWTDDNHLRGVQPVDPHFGSFEEFKTLVQKSHERGIRVIVDFVANHVHTDSPWWQDHPNADWFHFDYSDPAQNVCGWDRPITCWFAEYLPDLNYQNLNVQNLVMDHAVWLIEETNIDGFRLDAVKHMIHDFSYALRWRTDTYIDTVPGRRFYMVGETFTGEDGGGTIKEYVNPRELDGQFDFPMYWWVTQVFLREESDFNTLNNNLNWYYDYYGDDAVMSTFMGNHDVPRALSHAAGQIAGPWGNGSKEQGWNNPPGVPTDAGPFKRVQLAWTFLMTFKGIPLIYYGDEIGMPGAGDPDNRRMMVFGNDLTSLQQQTLAYVQKLGKARGQHTAMWKGTRNTISIDDSWWAYSLKDGDDVCVTVLNRGWSSRSEAVNVGGLGLTGGETLVDVLTGQTVTVNGSSITVSLGEHEAMVLVRQ